MKTALLAIASTLMASVAATTPTYKGQPSLTPIFNAIMTYNVTPLYQVDSPQGTTYNVPIAQ